jgi:electron transport complex protein RnfG
MNEQRRMILVLSTIAIASGLILAGVFQWTKPKMDEVTQERQKTAILEVLPGAVSYKEVGNNEMVFEGLNGNNQRVGIAFIAEGGGFQGDISMMVGMDVDERKLTGMTVLSHLETPGLGARIEEESFRKQFVEKSVDDPFVASEDIDAITGATISSNAVSNILRESISRIIEDDQLGGSQ